MVGRPLDEAELVARAKRGDEAAYEELVRMHQVMAFRTAYLLAGSTGDAEDAAHVAFIKAYRALARFRTGSPFRPWLLRIVANEALNRRRAAGRRSALTLRAADQIRPGDAAPSPEAAAIARERQSRLVEAIERLPEQHRLVLFYRFFVELSEAEMATALRVRPGTIKSRLARALERLRKELGDDV